MSFINTFIVLGYRETFRSGALTSIVKAEDDDGEKFEITGCLTPDMRQVKIN